ncbi:MAG: hypothetical protein ABIJ47_10900 [Candidatus Bathyarchaeota archaeon]
MNELRCPVCGFKLQYRANRKGWVCKNWKCPNYVKMSYGTTVWTVENPPPPISIKVGQIVPVTYLFELITGEIVKLSETKAWVKYKYKGKTKVRKASYLDLLDYKKWCDDEKSDPNSYYNQEIASTGSDRRRTE